MLESTYRLCLSDALKKAMMAKNEKARLAYLDLAHFYEGRLRKVASKQFREDVRAAAQDALISQFGSLPR
jgi:hypothetical protein